MPEREGLYWWRARAAMPAGVVLLRRRTVRGRAELRAYVLGCHAGSLDPGVMGGLWWDEPLREPRPANLAEALDERGVPCNVPA